MAETAFGVLSYFLERQQFSVNSSFTAANAHSFIAQYPWYELSLVDIYRLLHARYNGNAQACRQLLTSLQQQNNVASKHVVGVAGVWLLFVYTTSFCRSRSMHPDTPLVLQKLQNIMESVVSGCYTTRQETGEQVREGPLCETVQPEHNMFDCLEYWFDRQQKENKDHDLSKFIDMQLIRSDIAAYTKPPK